MALTEQNTNMSGVVFSRGHDVTADLLTGMQQYLATELLGRSKDFIKYAGFASGFRIGLVQGRDITITQGSATDQDGVRLYNPSDATYRIVFETPEVIEGYLCVRKKIQNVAYRIHPYNGTRQPTETVVGLEFYVDTNFYTDYLANAYPSDRDGLILAKLTLSGASYTYEDTTASTRSPELVLKDGR